MKTLSWSAGVALLAAALCAPNANAATDKCQRTIAKASSQFVQAKMKAMQKCEDGILKGKVVGPCPDAKAAASISKASGKLTASINKSCGGADKVCGGDPNGEDTPASLGWPTICPSLAGVLCESITIDDCGDIAACLECNGEAEVDQAVALYYDALAPHGGDKALQKCQGAIGKESAKFFAAKTKSLQKCWDARLKGKHGNSCVPPATGDGKYLAAIQKAEAKKTKGICKACGGGDKVCGGGDDFTPAQIGFASECPAGDGTCGGPITDVASIDACTYCVTEFVADCGDQAAVPQYVSYPATCSGGCAVPPSTDPCPTSLEFTAEGLKVDLDTGFTGLAHDAKVPTNGRLTLGVSGCAGSNQPTCGQCSVSGPEANAGGAVYANHRCQDQPWVTCSIDQDCIDAGALGPCIFFFGAPLPLVAGSVSTCVLNEVSGPVTGTVNLDDGTSTTNVPLNSKVHPTGTIDAPCPNCVSGTCTDGPRVGQACTAMGTSLFGDVSLDCPPNPGSIAGTLGINLVISTGTQTRTVSTDNPLCRQTGYTTRRCLCDTCNNVNAESCSTNADCPMSGGNPGICGGRRCLLGPNDGAPCSAASECPSGSCNRPGEPTQPNVCLDDTTTPSEDESLCADAGDNEGVCTYGPTDKVCSGNISRGCINDADCNPPVCPSCESGQTCISMNRQCFVDNGIVGESVQVDGAGDTPCDGIAKPTVGTFFCVAPVSAPAVNAAGGLPALGRVRIPGIVETLP